MADNTKTVSVGTSATEIVSLVPKRRLVLLHNNGSNTVYLGFDATDCTVGSSMPLLVDTYIKFKDWGNPIYGIVASGTEDVRVWEDTA